MSISQLAQEHQEMILDGTKIAFYTERVAAWERGEKIAPVTIDMALTRTCIEGDQLVSMFDGHVIKMRDLKIGDWVLSVNKKGELEPSLIINHLQTSKCSPIIAITCEDQILKCTKEHPILTLRGWVEAGKLQKGDLIAYYHSSAKRSSTPTHNINEQNAGEITAGASRMLQKNVPIAQIRNYSAWTHATMGKRTASQEDAFAEQDYADVKRTYNVQGGAAKAFFTDAGKESGTKQRDTQESWNHTQSKTWKAIGRITKPTAQRWEDKKLVEFTQGRSSQQDGGKDPKDAATIGISIQRKLHLLDWALPKRFLSESRFYIQIRTLQDSCTLSWKILAQRLHRCANGIRRLSKGWMESSNNLGGRIENAYSKNSADYGMVKWSSILEVADCGSAPVYDIECFPNHNFVVSSIVAHNCNFACQYCYATLQENQRYNITKEVMHGFLDDCAEIGVKGVSLVSDGESTLNPAYEFSIVYGHSLGLSMASGTNAYLLRDEAQLRRILPCLTYLRVNITAGESARYKEIMGVKDGYFEQVCSNIKLMGKIKKELNLPVTIGLQMVFLPSYKDQVIPLTRLGKELGADYLVIKHCSDDETGSLGVNYDEYKDQVIRDLLKEAEGYSDENYVVKAKWSKITDGSVRSYTRCYGTPFLLQISGSGLVAPCGMLFGDKYNYAHIGNITKERFKDIWASDRYWEVVRFLASDQFNAQKMCGSLCLQHSVNKALDNHVKGTQKIEAAVGPLPAHGAFV